MRLRTIGLAAALSASLFATSDAVVRPRGAEDPVVTATQKSAPRAHRTTTWSRASQMDAIGLHGWTAMFDRDTGVPVRMWGAGIPAFGSMAHPAIAESAARDFIAQHLQTLAPGAQLSDFVVVANKLGGSGDVRSVGFQQYAGGVPVKGGSIGISFKADRLVMVGSTALPNVSINASPRALDLAKLTATAQSWLAADGYQVAARAVPVTRVILPLVRPRAAGGIEFHLVDQLSVESTTADPGRWNVWIDATTGAPIARASTLKFASGRVLFAVPDRSPTFGPRTGKPAPKVSHKVNTIDTVSGDDGTITWPDGGAGDATIIPGLVGPLVKVTNKAGSLVADSLTLQDGGEVVWDRSTEEFNDAQISAFVFASTAKEYARTHMNPELQWLDDQLSVSVNENQTCNAFSTGDDIHFYKAAFSNTPLGGTNCQNTARIADVVYHEFGHSLHAQSIIEGVGEFDGALSEGMADMLAAFITKDHGMGRGFFFGEAALRDLDPAVDKRWPDDATGEVHDDGEIIGGTMWDLRKALIAKMGEEAGDAYARKLYYGALQRASDIPTTFAEVLLSDDDDGNLENGTPNQCEINAAYGPHGLADPRITLGLTDPTRTGYDVSFKTNPPQVGSACPPSNVRTATIDWKVRGGELQTAISFTAEGTTWTGSLPKQKTGTVLQYKVTITLEDGTTMTYPNNLADPFYEYYVGEVEPLYCADFESGGADWTHAAIPENRDEWEVGTPMGLGGDPKTAHGGTNVLGIDLSNDGMYRRNAMTYAESPEIDLAGNTNVRLQYYRWLTVEDGTFDVATIYANDAAIWSNAASGNEEMGGLDHLDKEWRFQDVDLSAQAMASTTGKIKLKFEILGDQGENKGGWTLDDVCVVIAKPAPECEASDTCDVDLVEDNGCCSVGSKPYGGLLLSLATLGLVFRRRRRR